MKVSIPVIKHIGFGACMAGVSSVVFAVSLTAQTSPDSATSEKSDEVVTLPEFYVQGSTDNSYYASESVTGSRVATAIKDLPFVVNVVTSQFMSDFGFFEVSDNLAYTSSVNNVDVTNGGGSNMRGFNSQYMLRDGFFRLGTTDPVLIDRIEFIKGPNAAVYGETQPGGIVNMITKRPKTTQQSALSLTTGSYGTFRGELTSTGPVAAGPQHTYYFFALSDFERTYDVPGATLRNRSAALGIEHRFDNGGNLYVLYSYMRNQSHTVQSNVPYNYNSQTKRYEGIAYNLANLNQNGPDSETTRDVNDLTVTFEKHLTSIFSVRAATNWYHRHKWLFNAGNGTQYDYIKGTLSKGTPAKGLIGEDGGGVQADLLAHYQLLNGKVDNKTLLTFDFSDYYRFDPTWNLPNQYIISDPSKIPASGPYWLKTITIGQPIDYSVPAYSPAIYTNTTRYNKNRASIWGALFRHQMSLMENRLLLFGSLRYDNVKFNLSDYLDKIVVHGSTRAWSPTVGLNYKVTPNIAFYASRSNGFNANAQNQSAKNGIQPSEKSWGYDYGIKASYLDDKLVFTLGGYYIVRRNVATTDLQPDGTTITTFTGSQLGRGVEFDFTWRVSDNLTFLGGYGHNNTIYTSFGRDVGAVGYSPRAIPHDNFGVAGKYNFPGQLHGLSVNAGVTFIGRSPAENPNTGDLFDSKTGVYIGNDGRRDIMLPSYTLFDVGLHYRFNAGAGEKINHTIGLNVKNVLDKTYIRAASAHTLGDSRGFYLTYRIGI